MKKKLRVGVLFGGRSGEHEVSLLSAASVLKAIDRTRYEVVPIGITKQGLWVVSSDAERLLAGDFPDPGPSALRAGDPQHTAPAAVLAKGTRRDRPADAGRGRWGGRLPRALRERGLVDLTSTRRAAIGRGLSCAARDVWRRWHHAGLFELAGLAYVGSGVLGSATGMDKEVMKRLFLAAGLPITKHVTFLRREWEQKPEEDHRQARGRAQISALC